MTTRHCLKLYRGVTPAAKRLDQWGYCSPFHVITHDLPHAIQERAVPVIQEDQRGAIQGRSLYIYIYITRGWADRTIEGLRSSLDPSLVHGEAKVYATVLVFVIWVEPFRLYFGVLFETTSQYTVNIGKDAWDKNEARNPTLCGELGRGAPTTQYRTTYRWPYCYPEASVLWA